MASAIDKAFEEYKQAIINDLKEKAKKDVLWKIEVTVPREEMEDVLADARTLDIPFNYVDIEKYVLFNFYSATQKMSVDLKEMLKNHNAKYFVVESKNL